MRARGFRVDHLVRPLGAAPAWRPALSGTFTGQTDEQASTFATLPEAQGMAFALFLGHSTVWRIVDVARDVVVAAVETLARPIAPALAACAFCHRPECRECRTPSRVPFLKPGLRFVAHVRPRGAGIYTAKGAAWTLTRFL